MWEMAYVLEKRLTYVGNDVDLWEMAKIYGKWLRYMAQVFLGYDFTILEMT